VAISGQAVVLDGDKLMRFGFRAVEEVGATVKAALVVMGWLFTRAGDMQ
jgi:hypothetical protein